MYKTHKQLIDAASCRCSIGFEEGRAVRAYSNDKEINLPMVNTVFLPGNFMGMLCSKGFLEYSRLFEGIISYGKYESLPDVKDKEFYLWAFFHGCDYSHHGEPCYTGLLVEAKYLDESKDLAIDTESDFYKLLKCMEDMDAPQCGPRKVDIDQKMSLEEKVVKILQVNAG